MDIMATDDLFSIAFENGYATIAVGDRTNRFCCREEDEDILSHMMDVIAHNSGLYGTDIVDFECIFERCSNHRFSTYPNRRLNADNPMITTAESTAAILFIIGGVDMGLSDVNRIVKETVRCYPASAEILFNAENSEGIPAGHYMLCILE